MTFKDRMILSRMAREQCHLLVGLDLLTAAIACDRVGLKWRVVSRDGIGQMITADTKMERINFYVVRGKVTSASVG